MGSYECNRLILVCSFRVIYSDIILDNRTSMKRIDNGAWIVSSWRDAESMSESWFSLSLYDGKPSPPTKISVEKIQNETSYLSIYLYISIYLSIYIYIYTNLREKENKDLENVSLGRELDGKIALVFFLVSLHERFWG